MTKIKNESKLKWINHEIITNKERMIQMYSLRKNNTTIENKHNYNRALAEYRISIDEAQAHAFNDRITNSTNKPKETWKIIDEWRGNQSNCNKHLNIKKDDKEIKNPVFVGNLLNDSFLMCI